MRKTIMTIAAAASIPAAAIATPKPAEARCLGCWVGAGIAAAVIGGALASRAYGYGVNAFNDCVLGVHFGHSGGLPGYGSNVLFVPGRALAVFAFANRTYAPISGAVREAANTLVRSGAFPERVIGLSPALRAMAQAVQKIYSAGDVMAAPEALGENLLLDHDAASRNAGIGELRKKFGACRLDDTQQAETAMSATLVFDCAEGRLQVEVGLAPTTPATLQTLEFAP